MFIRTIIIVQLRIIGLDCVFAKEKTQSSPIYSTSTSTTLSNKHIFTILHWLLSLQKPITLSRKYLRILDIQMF